MTRILTNNKKMGNGRGPNVRDVRRQSSLSAQSSAASKIRQNLQSILVNPFCNLYLNSSRPKRADLKSHDPQLGHTCVRAVAAAHAAT
nr:unnamed protein product [Spirometra erinaceieuropaei]